MIRYNQRLSDYSWACLQLVWQRQAMLAGGFIVFAFFFDLQVALLCYAMCLLAEIFDIRTCRAVHEWSRRDGRHPAHHVRLLAASAVLSSGTISVSVVILSLLEGPTLHLGALCFLFAAGLYTTMNTCQVTRLLRMRLRIYQAAMLFIPVWDLIQVRPGPTSPLWMQLITVVFLLYMLKECARSFASGYRSVRTRMTGLRQERDAAARAYEAQSQFVSVVSHELRTPLTSIKASLDLIGGEAPRLSDGDIENLAGIGRKNTDRLASLIDDLLDFQKLSAGKMLFRMDRLDLVALVRETLATNAALGADRQNGMVLEAGNEPLWVRGDSDRLHQVILNVLSNAIKFSGDGQNVHLRIEADGAHARLFIRDTGIGIPPEARDAVFAPFAQVDATDRRKFGGTGLGMSISRAIMEGHGGRIDFESSVGKGTTFVVELDLDHSADAAGPDMNADAPLIEETNLPVAATAA